MPILMVGKRNIHVVRENGVTGSEGNISMFKLMGQKCPNL